MFTSIKQVWEAIDAGIEVFWEHDGYHLTIEPYNKRTSKYTKKGKHVLRITYIKNYFGSLLEPQELPKLFVTKCYCIDLSRAKVCTFCKKNLDKH